MMQKRAKEIEMGDKKNIDEMHNILRKLNESKQGTFKAKPECASEPEVLAMAEVLKKLQAINSGQASKNETISEGKANIDFNMAAQSKRTDTGVKVSNFEIKSAKKTIHETFKKSFYSIIDHNTGKVIYDDIGLFESAMGIVKHLLYSNNNFKINQILDLDREYTGAMVETHGYKKRLKHISESSAKYDIVSAKYSSSKSKLAIARMKILKAI